MSNDSESIINKNRQQSEERIQAVMRYLRRADLQEADLSLDAISLRFGYSAKESFSYAFKNIAGVNYSHFVQGVRVDEAKRILRKMAKNGEPIVAGELTQKVGLQDNQAFRELFKKNTGKTPYEFLKASIPKKNRATAKPMHPGQRWVQEQSSALQERSREGIFEVVEFLKKADLENDDVSAETLCKMFGYPKARFHQSFKEVTGVGYKEFMDELRLRNARTLLAESKERIPSAELTAKIGLKKEATTRSLFRKFEGVTPTEFQKQTHVEIDRHVERWVKKLQSMGATRANRKTRQSRMSYIERMMCERGIDEMIENELYLPLHAFLDKVQMRMGWGHYEPPKTGHESVVDVADYSVP